MSSIASIAARSKQEKKGGVGFVRHVVSSPKRRETFVRHSHRNAPHPPCTSHTPLAPLTLLSPTQPLFTLTAFFRPPSNIPALLEAMVILQEGPLGKFQKISLRQLRRWVMENPTKVDHKDINGRTPLMVAAETNAITLVEWLIDEMGARVSGVKPCREGPLKNAASGSVVQALLARGANPTVIVDRF